MPASPDNRKITVFTEALGELLLKFEVTGSSWEQLLDHTPGADPTGAFKVYKLPDDGMSAKVVAEFVDVRAIFFKTDGEMLAQEEST